MRLVREWSVATYGGPMAVWDRRMTTGGRLRGRCQGTICGGARFVIQNAEPAAVAVRHNGMGNAASSNLLGYFGGTRGRDRSTSVRRRVETVQMKAQNGRQAVQTHSRSIDKRFGKGPRKRVQKQRQYQKPAVKSSAAKEGSCGRVWGSV